MQKLLFVAIGGAFGSVARYWVGLAVAERMGNRFYFGTFVVNITACLIIGFSLAMLQRRPGDSAAWVFLIPVGFVGAYSTFSTFEWEVFTLLDTGEFLISALYVSGSVLLGLVAVWLGVMVARLAF